MALLDSIREWLGSFALPAETRDMGLGEFMAYDRPTSGRVTQSTSTRVSTVFACQRILIDAVSTLPMRPYIRRNGQRSPLFPYPLWMDAPHGSRDPNYGVVQYLAELTASLLGDGNAFVHAMPFAAEGATEVHVLPPGRVEVAGDQAGRVWYDVRLPGSETVRLDGMSIIHIPRLRRPGELRGLSPIDEARNLIGYAANSQLFGSSWYERGGIPSGVLEYPGEMTQEQSDELKERWNARHAGPDKVGVAILSGGMKYQALTPTFEQIQWIEGMRFSAEQIGALYGVPLHKLGIATPGAMSYASVEANEQAFINDTLAPLTETIAKAHDRLLPYRPASYIDLSIKGRLRGDTAARAEFYRSLWNLGSLSPNDIRTLEDQPPVPGGDVYRVPLALGSSEATATIALGEQAKVAKALVDAGYTLTEAAEIAGLPEPIEEKPTPIPPQLMPFVGTPPDDDTPADEAPPDAPPATED